jgi:hypothetical protein
MSFSAFMKQQVAFVSDLLFFCLGFIQTVLFLITTFTFLLLVYVVLRHSPKQLNVYRWQVFEIRWSWLYLEFRYIIINATFGFLFEFFTVSLHMYPLLPYPILVLHGFADFILLFGEVGLIVFNLVTTILASTIINWYHCQSYVGLNGRISVQVN